MNKHVGPLQPARPDPATAAALTDEFVHVALKAADHYALRIVRTLKLGPDAVDDVRQDLLLEVLRRAMRFDAERAACSTFVRVLMRHASDEVAGRMARQRRTEGGSINREVIHPDGNRGPMVDFLSEEDGIGALWAGRLDPVLALERRIDIERFLARLPERLQRLCQLLQEEDTAIAAQLRSGLSPAEFYREVEEVRMRLRSVGLGWGHGGGTP